MKKSLEATKHNLTRREFLRNISLASAGVAISPALLNLHARRAGAAEVGSRSSSEFVTQNVFIVVIDGLRMAEAFDADDPTVYIPNIWNELRPQGTVIENYYNNYLTLTRSGHSTMLTGVWDYGIQNKIYNQPKEPTIFEYYRRQFGLSQSKAWFISGRESLSGEGSSTYPDYSPQYGASWEIVPNADGNDYPIWERVKSIMINEHPSLFMINFPATDHWGHSGIWDKYVEMIRKADNIVYELWNAIQKYRYKDVTTMFLVSDHGRHDEAHGGFQHHWCDCLGCRKLMFLAIGPDIKENTVVSTPYEQIDMAPTVGALLGFDTPLVQGRIMKEIFVNPPDTRAKTSTVENVPEQSMPNIQGATSSSQAIEPALAIDSKGYLHLVWVDDRDGNWQIYYTTSTDNGENWSDELKVSTWSAYCYEPVLSVDAQDNIHIAWHGYPYDFEGGDNGEGGPRIFYWNSALPAEVVLFPDLWAVSPDIAIGADGKIHLVFSGRTYKSGAYAVLYPNLYYSYSVDDGLTWAPPRELTLPASHIMELPNGTDLFLDNLTFKGLQSALSPRISVNPKGFINVFWRDCFAFNSISAKWSNWDIYGIRSINNGETWSLPKRISTDKNISFDPDVTLVNGQPFYVWSDNRLGHWEVFSNGETQISDSGVNVWAPSVDGEVVVWTDYKDGNPEIYVKDSDQTPLRVTYDPNFSISPSVVVTDQHIHLVWSDNRTGNWEIYYQLLQR